MKVLCGTPKIECTGGNTQVSAMMGGSRKAHSGNLEAFRCYAAYLLRAGYERVGSREFRNPDGGITVLTKKSRFGSRLRKGKAGGDTGGSRYMPKDRTGGTIISK
ncbi:hypothetical protein LCGC14_1844780 [marine sediment metagenome]|uniref:Uncharacterized protein n=1 Tax=marine sediment metagenome TaxID=412755 RepID=A0A0F9H0F2_9ZZZZ